MRYFTNCKTAEELKKEYRELCKQLHPDNAGNAEDFKKMQDEFSKVWERLKNVHVNKDGEQYEKETEETATEFMDIIENLIKMNGVDFELCGSWFWIYGDTKPYKEKLKELGGRWSKNKKAWYIHREPYRRYHGKKEYSLDDIREMYGSTKFRKKAKESENFITAH